MLKKVVMEGVGNIIQQFCVDVSCFENVVNIVSFAMQFFGKRHFCHSAFAELLLNQFADMYFIFCHKKSVILLEYPANVGIWRNLR
jgi:hypothetical protein